VTGEELVETEMNPPTTLTAEESLSDSRAALVESSTCIEGEWDEAMALIRQCHREARQAPST